LHWSAINGHKDMVEFVAHDADLTIRDPERTTMATAQTQHLPGIRVEQMLSLVQSIINPLVPSIPIPPPERWDRFVRVALGRVFGPQPDPWLAAGPSPLAWLDRVELNPQPLPPRSLFLKALAEEIISHAGLLQELTVNGYPHAKCGRSALRISRRCGSRGPGQLATPVPFPADG
jgi:hypothetical protein